MSEELRGILKDYNRNMFYKPYNILHQILIRTKGKTQKENACSVVYLRSRASLNTTLHLCHHVSIKLLVRGESFRNEVINCGFIQFKLSHMHDS